MGRRMRLLLPSNVSRSGVTIQGYGRVVGLAFGSGSGTGHDAYPMLSFLFRYLMLKFARRISGFELDAEVPSMPGGATPWAESWSLVHCGHDCRVARVFGKLEELCSEKVLLQP